MGSQRVGHSLVTKQKQRKFSSRDICPHTEEKYNVEGIMQQEFSQLFLQMSPYQAIMLIINSTTNVSTVTTRISCHRYLSYKDIFLVPFKKKKKIIIPLTQQSQNCSLESSREKAKLLLPL